MWYLVAGLLFGVLLGLNVPWKIPSILARYLAVSLLAGIDTSLGGLRASLEGEFDTVIFVSGFIGNTVLAAAFVYLGDVLGIELYLAAVVALGVRIFNNLGVIRRHYIRSQTDKKTALRKVSSGES
ncbi:MAG: small basic family protein [Candidatus Fermentithermobacillus carboniphilus]|uniref:Small basic family protein n=1 Tax=Candidatus Fermentithermobacillus carboniphilus TaxID=3085328 RepID=A0AAT9LBP5_9FIRM|nr:MAG: small basic family protein [Candidatus Fermentithermobacillus carboniphilus]